MTITYFFLMLIVVFALFFCCTSARKFYEFCIMRIASCICASSRIIEFSKNCLSLSLDLVAIAKDRQCQIGNANRQNPTCEILQANDIRNGGSDLPHFGSGRQSFTPWLLKLSLN